MWLRRLLQTANETANSVACSISRAISFIWLLLDSRSSARLLKASRFILESILLNLSYFGPPEGIFFLDLRIEKSTTFKINDFAKDIFTHMDRLIK